MGTQSLFTPFTEDQRHKTQPAYAPFSPSGGSLLPALDGPAEIEPTLIRPSVPLAPRQPEASPLDEPRSRSATTNPELGVAEDPPTEVHKVASRPAPKKPAPERAVPDLAMLAEPAATERSKAEPVFDQPAAAEPATAEASISEAPTSEPSTAAPAPLPVLSAARPAPDPRKTIINALILFVPIAACLLFIVWIATKRRAPAPPPPPVVEVAPPPAPSPLPVVAPRPPPAAIVPTPAPIMLGGKQVVLEYDGVKDVNDGAEPAVKKAREAFIQGNERLAAGDKKGALAAFRESLKQYPAYVGAYRGLGRALLASGDKKGALKSFKFYLNAVPDADDADDVKKYFAKPAKKKKRR